MPVKYYVKVDIKVIKQLEVENLTEEEIWSSDDLFEYAVDEMEIDRTNDWHVLEVNPYVPLPGEEV